MFQGLKASFDTVAEGYDAIRPSYPEALVEAVLRRAGLGQPGKILEIGAGTGLATLPFAVRGHAMLCLEPGANLAAVAARKLARFPEVRIETVTFEKWTPEGEGFDLVISAQAFHWIAAESGLGKVASVLRAAGGVALFWNLGPVPEEDSLPGRIDRTYDTWAPELAHEPGENPLSKTVRGIEATLRSSALGFEGVAVEHFPWVQRYGTAEYLQLLNTYSNHLALPEDRRSDLYAAIVGLIDENGGFVDKKYTSTLLFARKAMG